MRSQCKANAKPSQCQRNAKANAKPMPIQCQCKNTAKPMHSLGKSKAQPMQLQCTANTTSMQRQCIADANQMAIYGKATAKPRQSQCRATGNSMQLQRKTNASPMQLKYNPIAKAKQIQSRCEANAKPRQIPCKSHANPMHTQIVAMQIQGKAKAISLPIKCRYGNCLENWGFQSIAASTSRPQCDYRTFPWPHISPTWRSHCVPIFFTSRRFPSKFRQLFASVSQSGLFRLRVMCTMPRARFPGQRVQFLLAARRTKIWLHGSSVIAPL